MACPVIQQLAGPARVHRTMTGEAGRLIVTGHAPRSVATRLRPIGAGVLDDLELYPVP